MHSPLIKLGRVSCFGSEGLQQLPVEAVPAREGRSGGELEAYGSVPGEADVAVGSVGDVLHQPLHTHHRRAVDVKSSTCSTTTQQPQSYSFLERFVVSRFVLCMFWKLVFVSNIIVLY